MGQRYPVPTDQAKLRKRYLMRHVMEREGPQGWHVRAFQNTAVVRPLPEG
jgi:hypothetical protein